jgi:nicotinate-nucleotide pyrophosphorylase (carboxylating)
MIMPEFNELSLHTRGLLEAAGLSPHSVREIIVNALLEDLVDGDDITTNSTVPAEQRSEGVFASRAEGCIAGVPLAIAVLDVIGGEIRTEILCNDGARVQKGDQILWVTAPTRRLLTAERTALNLLCHLSGVATHTAKWADALQGTTAKVRDTRKTTPGLRALEKYAVRCGGGLNHRMSLSDAALVKDNHIVAAGGVAEAFAKIRAAASHIPIEIEVDTIEQLETALNAGADVVLLDNMPPEVLRQAVAISRGHTKKTGKAVILEASGGLTLANANEVAATGIDFISVGALTHSSPVLDIGLDLTTVVS